MYNLCNPFSRLRFFIAALLRTAYPKMKAKLCNAIEAITADGAADEQLALATNLKLGVDLRFDYR